MANFTKATAKGLLEKYLMDKGIHPSKAFRCLDPNHEDRHPSMTFWKKGNLVKCFSCGATFDIFDILEIDTGITDFKEKLKYLEEWNDGKREVVQNAKPIDKTLQEEEQEPKKTKTSVTLDYIRACADRIGETDYLINRGISKEVLKQYMIGYDPKYKPGLGREIWKAVIFPKSEKSIGARNTDPNAEHQNRIDKKGESFIFNRSALGLNKIGKPVFITEGEVDCLSILEVGGQALALGGVTFYNTLLTEIKLRQANNTLKAKEFIIALDNDGDGIKYTKLLEAGLKELGVDYICADVERLYQGEKDANESLLKDRAKFTEMVLEYDDFSKKLEKEREIEETIKQAEEQKEKEAYYLNRAVSNHIQDFIDGIGKKAETSYIPSGFKKLDDILDGGFYEGLYIVGAISSLGKTTLVTQIADQIAEQGQDVLVISLEMAMEEIMAKSISRQTYIDSVFNGRGEKTAKTTRGITTSQRYRNYSSEEMNAIKEAVAKYEKIAEHLFIYEGIGDIGASQITELVDKHIRYTGNKPVVIIDYVQILAPYNERMTDKANTDKAILELKRLSRDEKITVIGISSFNRDSYSNKVSMRSFKESGAIEYGSDVLIGLQLKGADDSKFDVDQAKQKNPREIELVILKNRNGATGKKLEYKYYPMFNFYEEV